jgi:large subunit ribosomal protein L17
VIQRLAEKLVTKARIGTLSSQRLVAAFLQNKLAVEKMVKVWGPLFKKRGGGFTRLIRLGQRPGDGAMRARLEFVTPAPAKEKDEDQSYPKK